MGKLTALERVREHLEAGHTGSATELAAQLGMERYTTYGALKFMVDMGTAASVDRWNERARGKERVFSLAAVPKAASTVARALASQPPLARVWHCVAARHDRGARA